MNHCIYHKKCSDGFGSAFAVWKKHGNNFKYSAWSHYEPLPNFRPGDTLYFCDIAPSREQYQELIKTCTVYVIDHHITTKNDLEGVVPSEYYTFDLNKSGAILTWEYFHGSTKIPEFLKYIQIRDLYKFTGAEGEEEIIEYIYSYSFNFESWDKELCKGFNKSKFISNGKSILRAKENQMEFSLDSTITLDIDGDIVPAINTKDNVSALGHKLCDLYPKAKFAAIYSLDKNGLMTFSLRSTSTDVGAIAKKFGGGGHKFASGFRISQDKFNPTMFDRIFYRKTKVPVVSHVKDNIYKTDTL